MTDTAVIWRCLFRPGMEHFALSQQPDGWRLAGTVIVVADDQPLLVTYSVDCSSDWHTRHVDLAVTGNGEQQSLALQLTSDGNWLLNNQPVDAVTGCIDVDLGVTPSTNTLPIRRLNLAIGESEKVTATWVQFPSLEMRPLSQRYTRISEHCYRYESDTGFTADLEVDDAGVVTTYPGGWERVG